MIIRRVTHRQLRAGAWALMALMAPTLFAQSTSPRYRGTVWLSSVQKAVATVTATLNVSIQDNSGASIANPSAFATL